MRPFTPWLVVAFFTASNLTVDVTIRTRTVTTSVDDNDHSIIQGVSDIDFLRFGDNCVVAVLVGVANDISRLITEVVHKYILGEDADFGSCCWEGGGGEGDNGCCA